MDKIIYKLADGRLWDCLAGCWIDAAHAFELAALGYEAIGLVTAEGISDEKYLAKTLAFYGYPLGELALLSVSGIKEALNKLDAEYLTARTLAGLSANDPEAIARWNEHEEKAIPLRARLHELEDEQAEE